MPFEGVKDNLVRRLLITQLSAIGKSQSFIFYYCLWSITRLLLISYHLLPFLLINGKKKLMQLLSNKYFSKTRDPDDNGV